MLGERVIVSPASKLRKVFIRLPKSGSLEISLRYVGCRDLADMSSTRPQERALFSTNASARFRDRRSQCLNVGTRPAPLMTHFHLAPNWSLCWGRGYVSEVWDAFVRISPVAFLTGF